MPYGLLLFLIFIQVWVISINQFTIEKITAYQDIGILLACWIAFYFGIQINRTFHRHDLIRKEWLRLTWGVLLFSIGETIYFIYETVLGILDPFPCIADGFIVFSSLLFIQAFWRVLILVKPLMIWPDHTGKWVSGILTACMVLFGIRFVVYPGLTNTGESWCFRVMAQIYPVLDLVEFALGIRLCFLFLSVGNSALVKPWGILTSASVLWLLADISYSYSELNEFAQSYPWCNLLWFVAYALTGIAFYEQYRLLKQSSAFSALVEEEE